MNIRILVLILALLSVVVYGSQNTHYHLAKEFIKINLNENIARKTAEGLTDGLIKNKPQLQPFREVYVSHFEKIFISNEYVNGTAKIYMKNFSEDELEHLIKVFSNPKMSEFMNKMPVITEQSMTMGQHVAKIYQGSLDTALKKRAKEIESLEKKKFILYPKN